MGWGTRNVQIRIPLAHYSVLCSCAPRTWYGYVYGYILQQSHPATQGELVMFCSYEIAVYQRGRETKDYPDETSLMRRTWRNSTAAIWNLFVDKRW